MLRKRLDLFYTNYEEFLILGDLNKKISQTCMKAFCDPLESPVKDPTCFKNPENLSCIDLMYSPDSPNSFQNLCALEIGLFDFIK